MKLFWKIMRFLVYVFYTQPGYQTSICGKNRAYYIRIFTVSNLVLNLLLVLADTTQLGKLFHVFTMY